MNRLKSIKICGLSTPEAIDEVVAGGASHAGFIFFEKSPRCISMDTAKSLSACVSGRILKVAVTVDAADDEHDAIVSALEPDMLQLHGKESPERVSLLKKRYGLPVMKAISVSTRDDLDKTRPYSGLADMFLFDAKAPAGSEIPGGNGVAFDWNHLNHVEPGLPYLLSGGLNIENIDVALEKTRANGIDVSSGVESEPGVKDLAKIRRFLGHLRQDYQKERVS